MASSKRIFVGRDSTSKEVSFPESTPTARWWSVATSGSPTIHPYPATPARAGQDFTIGYLQLKQDPRYAKKRTFARYLLQPLGRPYAAAQVALGEVKFHGAAVGATFKLKRVKGKDTADLASRLDALAGEGVKFFLVDAPADVVADLAAATKGRELLLFNISAREDRLRAEKCQRHLMHVIPSYAMLMDAHWSSAQRMARNWLAKHGKAD